MASRCVLALIAILGAACEEQRQVPYIAPELANWPRPYEGRARLKLHVFEVGVVTSSGGPTLLGSSADKELPLFAYVLEHPRQGPVVIDTGLAADKASKENKRGGGLLGVLRRGEQEEGQDLPAQMKASGLDPGAVRWVLLSDLRFFNAGKVEAFTRARVVVGGSELTTAREAGGEYEQRLFDSVESWKILDWDPAPPLGTMRASVDLFDDGSCLAIDARGATPGTVAFLIRLESRPILLAGALAPRRETVRYAAKPALLHDADTWWDNIWRLKRFKDLEPLLVVGAGHDALELRPVDGVVWHEAKGRKPRTKPSATARPLRFPGGL